MIEKNKELQTIIEDYKREVGEIKIEECNRFQTIERGIEISIIYLKRLRDQVNKGILKDRDLEIRFFKKIKPMIMGKFLFFYYLQQIISDKPQVTFRQRIKCLRKKVDKYNLLFKKHQELFHYYKSGETKYDEQFFIRCNLSKKDYIHHPYSMLDSDFATSHDYIYANFRAHEMILEFLKEEIKRLKAIQDSLPATFLEVLRKSPYAWTAKRVALTELIYALVESRCINNGDVDIKTLSNHMCLILKVEGHEIYRSFKDLKMRENPIAFIEQMGDSVLKKIEIDYELKREKRNNSFF